jgi:predicted choloylglycine hydrolase
LNERAKKLYNQAISKGLANQKASDFYPGYLITCYRQKVALADNPKEDWELLQKALQICIRDKSNIYNSYFPTIYYYLGKFASEKSYKVEDGITYLQLYIEKQKDIVTFNQFPLDKAYHKTLLCYRK